MFSPSGFRGLFQPNLCERRVWLASNRPELSIVDTEFTGLLQEKGLVVEENHVKTVGPVEAPEYPPGAISTGFEDTLRLIEAKTPIIYQAVLISKDKQFSAIPDLLILDLSTKQYKIRDVKLATNISNHPEILMGFGLCQLIAEQVLEYTPIIEVVTGDGTLISPLDIPDKNSIMSCIHRIIEIENLTDEPIQPTGWSKCSICPYFNYCWNLAWKKRDVCTISGIEQGMVRALWSNGINTWDDVVVLGENKLAEITFQRGSQVQRIGNTRSASYFTQTQSLVTNTFIKKMDLTLPNSYLKHKRPIVVFDLENNIFDEIGLQVDVYLWGLLTVISEEIQEQELILAPPDKNGDSFGWFNFLEYMKTTFDKYGDLPIIHYSAHEKTKINKYIKTYGDYKGIATRILNNLWDMYRAIQSTVILPVPSYSLKQVEQYVGFKRSQEEYGGSWSIVRYNQYLEETDGEKAKEIINEIKTYNKEDLLATHEVYKWLEHNIC